MSTIIVCCVFYAILISMAAFFIFRWIKAWRLGLVWSRRRYVISLNSALLLFFQISNLTFMILGLAYAISRACRWETQFMAGMGYAQWTCCNFTLIILVALAHDGSVWRGATKSEKTKNRGNFFTGLNKSGSQNAVDNAAVDAAEKGISAEESTDVGIGENTIGLPADMSPSTMEKIEDTPRNKDASLRCTSFPIRDNDGFGDKANSSIVATALPEGDIDTSGNEAKENSDNEPFGSPSLKLDSPKLALHRGTSFSEDGDQFEERRHFFRVESHEPIPSVPHPALVIDAPWTIHLKKLLIWAVMQAMLTIMFIGMMVRGVSGRCLSDGPLLCGPLTVSSYISISFFLATIIFYFLSYLRSSWVTDRDIRSRPYAEMRFARMVFGVGHEQIMPVFVAFVVATIVLVVVKMDSCWTFVEIW